MDTCLVEAGIDRAAVYVTNAVKHFKFVRRGRLRIHQTPQVGEISACFPWLEREIELVNPRVVVALGATAGRALLGREFRVTRQRGQIVGLPSGRRAMGTIHPSALLRMEDEEQRRVETRRLVDDLASVVPLLAA